MRIKLLLAVTNRGLRSARGSALVPVLLLITLMGALSYVLPDIYVMAKRRTIDTDRSTKIRTVAHNLKESAKFLLFYERLIYTKNPLQNNKVRREAEKELWGQSFGSWGMTKNYHMINVCGGYDAMANYVGIQRLAVGHEVLCPMYLRNPQLSGIMLQDLVFERWAQGDKSQFLSVTAGQGRTEGAMMSNVIQRRDPLQPGNYYVEMDMTPALLAPESQAFDVVLDDDLRTELKTVLDAKAKIGFEFYTDAFGFEMPENERFVRVYAQLEFKESPGKYRTIKVDESFVLLNPTVKDFAIFVPYPTDSNGVPTKSMKKALALGGAKSKIEGRVFFNGDIDFEDLSKLPTFYETVIISGKIIPEPSPKDLDLFKSKFKKGVVINYDANKYVLDGKCATMDGQKIDVNNLTEVLCDGDIEKYVIKAGGACADTSVLVTGPGVHGIPEPMSDVKKADPQLETLCRPEKFVKSRRYVKVTGQVAFLGGAFEKVDIRSPASIYGVIFGGHIQAVDGTRFVALPYLRTGLPAIGTNAQLQDINQAANSIVEGVAVPLMGVPIVKSASEGMN